MGIDQIEYSVVVPVYNSEKTLNELVTRIQKVFAVIDKTYEIILVEDCSLDNSWKMMKELHESDNNVKIIHLLRNFGQHNATLCGFKHAKGKYVITLDDDLQHPPEEIPKLINKIDEGYLVVHGKYITKKHSSIENYFSNKFQILMHNILNIPSQIYLSSFAIYKSNVVKNMISIKSSYPFLPALMIKSTPVIKIGNVDIIHDERKIGKSNYNIMSHFKFSLNLIINYSSYPLTVIGIFGMLISISSLIFGSSIIINKIINPNYGVMGWNSLIVAITLLCGIILMGISIIGEYLKRILAEISHGQQYVVEEMYE